MFNSDALFGKKNETGRNDTRNPIGTPDFAGAKPRSYTPSPSGEVRVTDHEAQPSAQRGGGEELVGSKLIVGPDIKLRGVEITDCDTLVVEGRVEASMDSRVVQIAENGVFTGTATMDVAEIWGHFEGKLTARRQLVVYSTGRVSGDIRYGKIRVEEGGELSGEVATLSNSGGAHQKEASRDTKTVQTPRSGAGAPVRSA
jgi:cytoskeletal protein CcmA (bactofilin family)